MNYWWRSRWRKNFVVSSLLPKSRTPEVPRCRGYLKYITEVHTMALGPEVTRSCCFSVRLRPRQSVHICPQKCQYIPSQCFKCSENKSPCTANHDTYMSAFRTEIQVVSFLCWNHMTIWEFPQQQYNYSCWPIVFRLIWTPSLKDISTKSWRRCGSMFTRAPWQMVNT